MPGGGLGLRGSASCLASSARLRRFRRRPWRLTLSRAHRIARLRAATPFQVPLRVPNQQPRSKLRGCWFCKVIDCMWDRIPLRT